MSFPTIARFEDRNYVGICHFDVVDVKYVVSVPQEIAGNVAGSIVLADDAVWSRVYLEDDGGVLSDQWKVEGGDQYSDAQATGPIAKDRLALMPNLWKLKGQRYLVVATTRNGDQLLMGRKETPCMVRVVNRTTGDGDQMETDRNEYRIVMSLVRRMPVPFYQGVIPVEDPDEDCLTAVELLEEMTAEEIETALTDAGQLAAVQAEICEVPDDGSFRTTDGATEIAAVPPATNVNAPQSVTKYKTVLNATTETDPSDTEFNGTQMRPADIIPRRALKNSAATGYGYATVDGIINDTLPIAPDAVYQLKDTAGANIGAPNAIPSGVSANITAPDGTVLRDGVPYGTVKSNGSIDVLSASCASASYQLKDSAGANIGSPGSIASGGSANITAPDAVVQLKDSAGGNIGSADSYKSNSSNNKTAPDGTVKTTDAATTVMTVKSNGSGNLPQSKIKYKDAANADQELTASDTEYASSTLRPATQVPRRELKNHGGTGTGQYVTLADLVNNTVPNTAVPLKFGLAAGDADSYTWTVTTDEAGTYGTYTQDGGSGTLTYSKNGGAFAALSGSITLAVSDTIVVRRTTSTSNGWVKWAP